MARDINEEVINNDAFPATSRYKGLRYYKRTIPNYGERVEPESWNPDDIEESPNDYVTKVKAGEVGRLDLVSDRVYGTDRLWWVIALFNNIVDPFEEVVEGLRIKYPPFNTVANKVLG